MMISLQDSIYIPRCFSAGSLLPQITVCDECGNDFGDCFAAEDTGHGVLRGEKGAFSIIIGCEGYHQIRFDYGLPL
jgi:hypothetical protein